MRKFYESPEAEVVSFDAMEQLALLQSRAGEETDVSDDLSMTPGVSPRP